MQCYDDTFVVRVAAQSDAQIVGMPIVVKYKMPVCRDVAVAGNAVVNLADWFGIVDAMFCVIPLAAQLPLAQHSPSQASTVTPMVFITSPFFLFRCELKF